VRAEGSGPTSVITLPFAHKWCRTNRHSRQRGKRASTREIGAIPFARFQGVLEQVNAISLGPTIRRETDPLLLGAELGGARTPEA